jgi:hypothetical protein
MHPTKPLADALFEEQLRRAETMTPVERMLEGARLFDQARQRMRDGIRQEFPEADARRVEEILGQRLDLLKRLEYPDDQRRSDAQGH